MKFTNKLIIAVLLASNLTALPMEFDNEDEIDCGPGIKVPKSPNVKFFNPRFSANMPRPAMPQEVELLDIQVKTQKLALQQAETTLKFAEKTSAQQERILQLQLNNAERKLASQQSFSGHFGLSLENAACKIMAEALVGLAVTGGTYAVVALYNWFWPSAEKIIEKKSTEILELQANSQKYVSELTELRQRIEEMKRIDEDCQNCPDQECANARKDLMELIKKQRQLVMKNDELTNEANDKQEAIAKELGILSPKVA